MGSLPFIFLASGTGTNARALLQAAQQNSSLFAA